MSEVMTELIDAQGDTVKVIASPHDPRLRGEPNWIEIEENGGIGPILTDPAGLFSSRRRWFYFKGEVKPDGTLIFRES